MIVSTVNTGSTSVKLAAFEAGGGRAQAGPPPQAGAAPWRLSLLAAGSEAARFAVELDCFRAWKTPGAYLAVLAGCDGITFGGGVDGHEPDVRPRILSGLEWAGIELDPAAHRPARGTDSRISAADSKVIVRVIPAEEQLLMVRAALTVAKLA